MYAACNNYDDICMYLSLRVEDVNIEDEETGLNIFVIFLLKEDLNRAQQLIMRGASCNFCFTKNGLTPLHILIERRSPPKIVKWLIKAGADPHQEDPNGLDCCDKVRKMQANMDFYYHEISILRKKACIINPKLRSKYDEKTAKL